MVTNELIVNDAKVEIVLSSVNEDFYKNALRRQKASCIYYLKWRGDKHKV